MSNNLLDKIKVIIFIHSLYSRYFSLLRKLDFLWWYIHILGKVNQVLRDWIHDSILYVSQSWYRSHHSHGGFFYSVLVRGDSSSSYISDHELRDMVWYPWVLGVALLWFPDDETMQERWWHHIFRSLPYLAIFPVLTCHRLQIGILSGVSLPVQSSRKNYPLRDILRSWTLVFLLVR